VDPDEFVPKKKKVCESEIAKYLWEPVELAPMANGLIHTQIVKPDAVESEILVVYLR
jgi:hypothetical protein